MKLAKMRKHNNGSAGYMGRKFFAQCVLNKPQGTLKNFDDDLSEFLTCEKCHKRIWCIL